MSSSDANGKRRRPPRGASRLASGPCEPGDQQTGEWTRERLIRMNERFVERMERAISRGLERRLDSEAPERAA
jgi:hypothetical protein